MPIRAQITRMHLAQFRLHNGPPPGEQHEIQMLEDPAYRAAHMAHLAGRTTEGREIGTMEWCPRRQLIIPVFFDECPLWDPEDGGLDGRAKYDPKTGRMKIVFDTSVVK